MTRCARTLLFMPPQELFSNSCRVGYLLSQHRAVAASTTGLVRTVLLAGASPPVTGDIVADLTCLAISPSGGRAVATSAGGEAYLVDLTAVGSGTGDIKLTRLALPLRTAVFTHGDTRCVVGGDDNEFVQVRLPESSDLVPEQLRPATTTPLADLCTGVLYTPHGDRLAVSLANGDVAMYSLSAEEPRLDTTLPKAVVGYIFPDPSEEEAGEVPPCTAVTWDPHGELYALCRPSLAVWVYLRAHDHVLSIEVGEQAVDLQWCPWGPFLAVVAKGGNVGVYKVEARGTKHRVVHEGMLAPGPTNLAWTKLESGEIGLLVGHQLGQMTVLAGVVEEDDEEGPVPDTAASLFVDDEADLDVEEANADDVLLEGSMEDGFVIDDDGRGYAEPPKRSYDELAEEMTRSKRRPIAAPHAVPVAAPLKPYLPGATPWNNAHRRYLTLNSVGYVWSVRAEDESLQLVTCTFFDRSAHTEYYFQDHDGYDLAALTLSGCLYARSASRPQPKVYFRPHASLSRVEPWLRQIPPVAGPTIQSVALSDRVAVVATALDYVVVYSVYGQLTDMFKADGPVVACACDPSGDTLLLVYGGSSDMRYAVYDHVEQRFIQRGLLLPVPAAVAGAPLRGLFFNDMGDPCVVGHDHVLLVLNRWREPHQAVWTPLLDTRHALETHVGAKQLAAWPVGMYGLLFVCIGVRMDSGGFPGFPLPATTELEVRIPLSNSTEADPEEELVRARTLGELVSAGVGAAESAPAEWQDRLGDHAVAYDRAALQLFIAACQDTQTARAVLVLALLRDDRSLSAAGKIAERFGYTKLVTRIARMREEMMAES